MNERIQQLAEQATTIVDTVNSQGYSSSYANFDREKFAELMVLDTIKNCRDMFMVNSVSWNLLNEKLEHFGVKE
jgi:hypothetical protein